MGDNGIAAYVVPIPALPPNSAGELTCALERQWCSAYIHYEDRPYYTAYHVACLKSHKELTLAQKFYYCTCIRANRYRYGSGHKANRSLKNILVPSIEEIPSWLSEPGEVAERVAVQFENLELSEPLDAAGETEWKTVSDLFDVKYGHSYELCNLIMDGNGVNFVSRRTGNNGVSAKVSRTNDEPCRRVA